MAHKIYWSEPNLASGNQEKRAEFLNDIRKSVEIAKRVNAKWMTVVPGFLDLRQNKEYQTAHVVESLKQACDILEPHGLVMVLEPLNFPRPPGAVSGGCAPSLFNLQGSGQPFVQNIVRFVPCTNSNRQFDTQY